MGVQAQDARAARLGVRARSRGLTEVEVERERLEDRSFVRAWAMRGTIHLVAAEDFPWIRGLVAAPQISASFLRMGQEGLLRDQAERARKIVRKLLEDGPATRDEMRERLATRGIRPRGRQALVHLLGWMTYDGEIVTGPYVGSKETMVLLGDWLPGKRPRAPKDPAAEFVRRYLMSHGPATIEDFRWWSSVKAAEARAGFAAIGDELVEDGGLWRHRSQPDPEPGGLRMLPAWDHYYLAYRDRSHVGASEEITSGGMFNPFVAVDGRAVARWKIQSRRDAIDIRIDRFGSARIPAKELAREVDDVARFLGRPIAGDGLSA